MTELTVKSFASPEVSIREILRYAKAREDDANTIKLLNECLEEALPKLTYKTVHAELEVSINGNTCDIGGIIIHSAALSKKLSGVKRAILVTATVGFGIDRLTAKYSRTSPTKALLMQAIGTERVEALLDALTDEIRKDCKKLLPRFSVGYADAALEAQRAITERLNTAKTVGVFLSDSLIMTPTKSVTAIIGIDV
jgi:hypothetical protein